jgi:hypothetical protein
MRTFHKFLFGLTMLLPGTCLAQTKCPWINEATARGVLGGAVTVKTNIHERGDGVCEFSRQQGTAVHELRISVDVMTDAPKQFPTYRSQCRSDSTPLRSTGNEAVMCSVQTKGQYAEKVVGRVRDQAFVVSVSSNVQDDASLTREMRREKTQLVAEQVAGILF